MAPEIADIYLALHAYGPQSIAALARNSGVERTRIYRLMDNLRESALVEVDTHNHYSVFRAAPITNLQILISKKEQEVRDLQSELTELHRALNHTAMSSPVTRVQLFQGIEGIKQMLWNETKGTTENLSILYENMQQRVKLAFFERWVRACNEAGISFRRIISDHFVRTQQEWYQQHANERLARWRSGYVSDDVFPITHSMVVYDNVTAYYNWKDGQMFGLEVTNAEIANAQRKFFEMLWTLSVEIDDLQGLKQALVSKEASA